MPADYAEAAFCGLSQQVGIRWVMTLDSDFHTDRLADGSGFDVLPV